MTTARIAFSIEDDLATADSGAIEVVFQFGGERRWCFFMTPSALAASGDWVPGTQVRFHFDSPHMIVVGEVTEDLVGRVLDHLAEEGLLAQCSRPVDEPPTL